MSYIVGTLAGTTQSFCKRFYYCSLRQTPLCKTTIRATFFFYLRYFTDETDSLRALLKRAPVSSALDARISHRVVGEFVAISNLRI